MVDTRFQMHQWFGKLQRRASVEICGLLFWDSETKQVVPYQVGNTDPEPHLHFRIARSDADRLVRTMKPFMPVGLWHTHIERDNLDPSPHDLVQLQGIHTNFYYWRHWYGLIVHTRTRTLTYYNPQGVLYRRHLVRKDDNTFVAEYGPGYAD